MLFSRMETCFLGKVSRIDAVVSIDTCAFFGILKFFLGSALKGKFLVK